MHFITDLDKTIIYSREKEHICIEKKNEKEITYITEKSFNLLSNLLKNEKFSLIPCTLRSYEQMMRVDFIRENNLKYMICDNGATICIDGKIDEKWDRIIDSIVDREKVKSLHSTMQKFAEENNIPIYMIKNNRDSFISIIFYKKEDAYKYIDDIITFADDTFTIYKQGKKTYVVPKNLNKDIAVKYLIDTFNICDIVTSGDSSVDELFVKRGDKIILPSHATFRIPNSIVTENVGILAGEEIFKILYEDLNKNK